jgi:hypothetical protein
VTRCKTWTAILALLIVATAVPVVAAPQDAAASTLRARLNEARHSLAKARHRLANARAALAAAIAAEAAITASTTATPATDPTAEPTPEPAATDAAPDVVPTEAATPEPAATTAATAPQPTIEERRARVVKWRRVVRLLERKVDRLARAYRLQRLMRAWERDGRWRPIIDVAAKRYRVSADRMYRMMMRESGGRRYAGTMYKGLFQYHPGTWRGSWNPWRNDSIYDGSSQIFATAYAIRRGWGPSWWPNTY